MLTVGTVADWLAISEDTVRRRIRHKDNPLPAEPKLGVPTNGYLIPGAGLVAWLEQQGLPGQAALVRRRVAELPEEADALQRRGARMHDQGKPPASEGE